MTSQTTNNNENHGLNYVILKVFFLMCSIPHKSSVYGIGAL